MQGLWTWVGILRVRVHERTRRHRPLASVSARFQRFALTAVLGAAGCVAGESVVSGPPGTAGSAVLQVNANVATLAGTLVIEVTAPDITTPLAFNFTIEDGTVSGTITLPAGSDRTLTLRAYDTGGVETHRAAVRITVLEGSNPAVTVTLFPLSGDQPIDVTLGTIVILVEPQLPTVAAGEKVQLAAAVTDADGATLNVTVSWATLTPGVATVDANGVVLGLSEGTTEIVATYGGVGAAATVTVQASPNVVILGGLPTTVHDYGSWLQAGEGLGLRRPDGLLGYDELWIICDRAFTPPLLRTRVHHDTPAWGPYYDLTEDLARAIGSADMVSVDGVGFILPFDSPARLDWLIQVCR